MRGFSAAFASDGRGHPVRFDPRVVERDLQAELFGDAVEQRHFRGGPREFRAEARVDEPAASVVRVPPKLTPIAVRHGPMQLIPLAKSARKRKQICKADFAWIILGEIGDPPLSLERAQLNALRAAIAELVSARWQLFEAELDGRRALLLQGAFETGNGERLAARIAETLDVSAKLDCRPWRAIESVANF